MTVDPWSLVEEHRTRLFRIARRRTGSNADAEDIVQEAMIRAATFEGLDQERVSEFLTSTTMRLCADLARRRAVEARALPKTMPVADDPLADLLDCAEAHFLARVPLTKVERTLLLARIHGLYPSEVAASLGLTTAAAKMALERARRKIRAVWRTTLGLIGVSRLRRYVPAGAAVVAVALATALSLSTRPTQPYEDVAAQDHRPEMAQPRSAQSVGRPVAAALPAPSPIPSVFLTATPASLTTPTAVSVRVSPLEGPVWHRGITVVIDPSEHPVDRVQRCLREGIDIRPRQVHVTCRE